MLAGQLQSSTREILLPRGRRLPLSGSPHVMGIVNVTPDSFSDGGTHFDQQAAIDSALRMIDEGATIIDIGGESTRPGANPVDDAEELRRVVPVIEGVRARSDVAISIDTRKASVARRAIEAGADIVNDVSALRYDQEMAGVVADTGTSVILMHMRGEPQTMQSDIHYDDVIGEVCAELESWTRNAMQKGISPAVIMIDPGIGFGKTFDQNLELLAHTDRFARIAPVVIGASRKGFIGHLTGRHSGPERMAGSLAAVAAAATRGAAIVRVHDVRETADFLRVFDSIRNAGG